MKSYSIRMKISQNPATAAAATAGMSIVLVEREAQCKGVDKWTCSGASKLVLVGYRVIRQLEERSYYITHRICGVLMLGEISVLDNCIYTTHPVGKSI